MRDEGAFSASIEPERRLLQALKPRLRRFDDKALNAEATPGLLDQAITSRGFQRLFPVERLEAYRASFDELKGNKQVCEQTVTLSQRLLLAEEKDIDDIVAAVARIQKHSAALAKKLST